MPSAGQGPAAAAAAAAAASRLWTDVDSLLIRCYLCQHTLQVCHIGLECCWRRNQSSSHPYWSTPLHPSVNCLGLKTNTPPSPLSCPTQLNQTQLQGWRMSTVWWGGGGGVRWREGVCFDTKVTGCWLLERPKQTSSITLRLRYASEQLLTLWKILNHKPLKSELRQKHQVHKQKHTHTKDSQLSLCGETRNKKIWALRTHLFSLSYSSLVPSKSLKNMSTEKAQTASSHKVFTEGITRSSQRLMLS